MQPAAGAPAGWKVPALTTSSELAEWLQLPIGQLEWLADCRGLEAKSPDGPLRHYRYRWNPKPRGTPRLIEAPKPRLKRLQRRLLDEILSCIPPHAAAHGFRPGRGVRSFIEPHVGQSAVLRMDLKNFFATIAAARVAAVFRTAGYPDCVVRLLTGLCTNIAPREVIDFAPGVSSGPPRWPLESLYLRPHLPQGAPTSPALANLCAFALDCRLTGLARAAGATYTRYADDLLFSGGPEFKRVVERFYLHCGAIALEEGFQVQTRKTRIMRQGVRQQATGVVLNVRPNIVRQEFDTLKATLFNCVRNGASIENRQQRPSFREHLAGRIAWHKLINPDRARKLEKLFGQITWDR